MTEVSPEQRLWDLLRGALTTRALGLVADLRVADALADGSRAVDEELAAPLRLGDPPVVGIVRDGRLLLDCLTIADAEVAEVAAAVAAARG